MNKINEIIQIITDCEAVQATNESSYTKEQEKIHAYDRIVEAIGGGKGAGSMTREELINNIKYNLEINADVFLTDEDARTVIKVLEQEPCEDTVSRQAVNILVDELARVISDERCCMSRGRSTATIMQDILDLPPVNPKPKTGHWIAQDVHNCHTKFKCSECGYMHDFMHLYGKPTADYTYCPNCGAKMEVEE